VLEQEVDLLFASIIISVHWRLLSSMFISDRHLLLSEEGLFYFGCHCGNIVGNEASCCTTSKGLRPAFASEAN
jgi:hypothetical protein